MANNNDFKVILEAMIDNSSLTNVQKQLAKERLKINADISVEDFAKSKQEIEKQIGKLAKNIKNILGTAITDKQASQWAKQYYDGMVSGAKEAAKAQEKLNAEQRKNTLAEQEKYYKRIIENNKEIYALKEKKLSADKEESKELQRQITNLEKRNKRAYDSISQKGLGDTNWGLEVSNSEKELKNRLAIKEARLQDKANAQEQANVERQIAEYNKQELEYQKQRKQYESEGIKQVQDEELLRQSMEYYEQEKYYQETRAKYLAEGKTQEEAYNAEVKETTEYYKQMAKEADKAYESRQRLAEANAKKVDEIQLSTDISDLETKYKRFGIVSQEVETNLKELKSAHEAVITAKGTDRLATEIEKYDTALDKAKTSLHELTTTQVSMNQRTSQMTAMQEWMRKNKNATKLCGDQVQKLIQECQTCDKVRFDQIKSEFKELQVEAGKAGKLGNTLWGSLIEQGKGFIQWSGVSGVVMGVINKVREAVNEFQNLDDIITEIDKTSNLTTKQLEKLALSSYDSASKYGRVASSYLTDVQEMSRSGFYGKKGTAMAEQALLAESAGDMTADLANKYILATNAAYKLNGSAKELNKILDGQNSITNQNSVAMEDMATAMSEVGTVASSYRVSVEDLSAMIGTIESVTKLGGSEVGNGIKAILINLQNITSDKIVDTLDKASASMTEMVNGAEKLRDPISILRDLAKTFNELDEDDPLRAEILTNIGQKYHAQKLGALLQNMEMYDKMLADYSEGEGSAFVEAQKSANNLTGTINKLSNSWYEFVNSIVQSNDLKNGVNILNELVQGATDLTNALTPLGTLSTIGGGILGAKNLG